MGAIVLSKTSTRSPRGSRASFGGSGEHSPPTFPPRRKSLRASVLDSDWNQCSSHLLSPRNAPKGWLRLTNPGAKPWVFAREKFKFFGVCGNARGEGDYARNNPADY